jgi:regulator of replication initiation timing
MHFQQTFIIVYRLMSKVKYLLFLLCAWVLTINIYAQEGTQPDDNYQPSDSILALNKKICSEQDSINRLNDSIEFLNTSIQHPAYNIAGKDFPMIYIIYTLGGTTIIFILLLILYLAKITKKNKIIRANKDEIYEKRRQIEYLTNENNNLCSQCDQLKQRLCNTSAPQKNTTNVSKVPSVQSRKQSPDPLKPKKVTKYFGDCVQGYFTKVYNTKGDLTGFKVIFDSPTMETGTFELIDIYKVKSSDNVNTVMDTTNSQKKIEEATSARVLSPGKVKKEGNFWKVVTKVKVILS